MKLRIGLDKVHPHYVNEIDFANKRLLELSGRVEQMISMAVDAIILRKTELVEQVIAMDGLIDREEVHIEEECLKILALHQPVATDLRRITTMMKINNDLERMGDLACNIVERAMPLISTPTFNIPSLIPKMSEMTIGMVRKSLDAFVTHDVGLAEEVIRSDDEVDRMNISVIEELTAYMTDHDVCIDAALNCFSAARHLEQISDHATNIAADLVYMVSGRIVRHKHEPTATVSL